MEIGEKYTSNGIIYTIISDDSVEVSKCREGSHVVIPDTINIDDVTYWVKSIGMMAFFGKSEVVSVTIPSSL